MSSRSHLAVSFQRYWEIKENLLGFAGSPTWLGVAGYSEEWYLIVSLSDPSPGLCLFSVTDYFLSFNFFLFVVHIINNINSQEKQQVITHFPWCWPDHIWSNLMH